MVSSTPRPHFTAGKDPVPIVQEAGWAPGLVWTGGKSSSPPGFFLSFTFILQMFVTHYNRSGIDKPEIQENINKMS